MNQKEEFSPLMKSEDFDAILGSAGMDALLLNPDFGGPLGGVEYATDLYTDDENTVSLEDIKHFQVLSGRAVPLRPLAANDVLSNDEYLGPYNFDVSVRPNYKSKNPWVYSVRFNKVYMDMNQQFPVDFAIKNGPLEALYIRTTPQYSAQHHAGEPVCRCIQHDHHTDVTNKDIPDHVRQHVIRCSNGDSAYIGNSKDNQRLSIVFPLSAPQVGNESVRELFHFVCKSSCPAPGMNRREIEIIFTLEDAHGRVLGRKCLKVRICACPKRDKEKEEENDSNKTGNPAPRGKKRKTEPPPPASSGKMVVAQEDLTKYTLNMEFCGKQNLLAVLDYAEIVYKAKAYQLQGQSGEQQMKDALTEIHGVKRMLQ